MNDWTPCSAVLKFENAAPSRCPAGKRHPIWGTIDERMRLPKTGVFEEMSAGDPVRQDRDHVLISPSASVPDQDVPELAAKATKLGELLGNSNLSKVFLRLPFAFASDQNKVRLIFIQVKMNVVDAFYKQEVLLVPKLNEALADAPFGPFDHISEAVNELLRLRKAKKLAKVARFEEVLDTLICQGQQV